MNSLEKTERFIRDIFKSNDFIPLHEPKFLGKEKEYLSKCIDSTFVSYLGKYVAQFETMLQEFTGAKHVIAMSSGTAALHMGLISSGVKPGDEVITQALSFVATANAINYCGANPIFLDSSINTLGLCPISLKNYLEEFSEKKENYLINKKTGKKITAIVPMHVFGHALEIEKIIQIANQYGLPVIEDSAEAMGSFCNNKHLGTFGKVGILSFNGNKTITCGGGGALLTNDDEIAEKAKYLSTTAKKPHKWEYSHDEVGYNYRLANLNAAVACAQLEQLPNFLENKRDLANNYCDFFQALNIKFIKERANTKSNYWLNAILLKDLKERNEWLEYLNDKNIMARPVWNLLNKLEPYANCQHDHLTNALFIADRLINIPSSVRLDL